MSIFSFSGKKEGIFNNYECHSLLSHFHDYLAIMIDCDRKKKKEKKIECQYSL